MDQIIKKMHFEGKKVEYFKPLHLQPANLLPGSQTSDLINTLKSRKVPNKNCSTEVSVSPY